MAAIIVIGARLGFALALVASYLLALLPGDPHIVAADKGNHALAFATLGLLLRIGWPAPRLGSLWAGLLLFGAAIEISQGLPGIGRDASWADLFADGWAAAGGLGLGALLRRAAGA